MIELFSKNKANKYTTTVRKVLSFIIALFITSLVFADDVNIKASAPSTVEAGEKFRVQYKVNTSSVSGFSAPDFKGFEVIYGPSTSTESSFQIINGRASQNSSVTYTFVLLANEPGLFTIPEASVHADGKTLKSNSLKVKVVSGSGNSSRQQGANPSSRQATRQIDISSGVSSKELFMTATASRTKVFEQEAVLLTYKIYTLVNLTQLDGKLPTLDGFQIQEIPLPRNKEFSIETYNGRNYHTVVWSQYVLFPQKPGKLEIPSITYEGLVVQPNRNIDPIDAFFNGNSGIIEVKKKITTPKLTIDVSPLPTKPEGFSGAVGQFSISSSVNTNEVNTNDAVTLKVVVKGKGNMKLINTPKVDFPKDFEVYDAKVNDNFSLTKDGLSGTKEFEYLAVPRTPGNYTIPAVKFVYFDTSAKTYKTITTQSFDIKVNKGKGNSSQAVADFTDGQQTVKQLNQDIRYIKLGNVSFQGENTFFASLRYWLIYLFATLLFIAAMVVGYQLNKNNANTAKLRGRKASKVANKRMKVAAKLLSQKKQTEFYDEVLKTLWGYISDKLNIPQEQLTKDNVQNALLERNVEQQYIDEFIKALNDCEFARYAPGDANETMEKTYETAENAITNMENNIKK